MTHGEERVLLTVSPRPTMADQGMLVADRESMRWVTASG